MAITFKNYSYIKKGLVGNCLKHNDKVSICFNILYYELYHLLIDNLLASYILTVRVKFTFFNLKT